MSGITRSMPSMPSSGNMSPASTTTMSSPTSMASMFFPISPTPPSGTIRSPEFTSAKEGDLLRGFLFGHLLLRRRRCREEEGERGEVGGERIAERWLMQRRGRMVDGKNHEAVGGASRLAVDAGDRLAREELGHRVPAQGHDDARLQYLEVASKPDVAGSDLLGQRVAVLRRAVTDHVGDEDAAAVEADAREKLIEELAGRTDEGLSLQILVVAGRLAEEEDPGLARTVAWNGLPRAPMERAGGARADLGGDEPESGPRCVLHGADYGPRDPVFGPAGALRAR